MVFNALSTKASEYLLLSEAGTSASMIRLGNISGFDLSSAAIFENPASLFGTKDISISLFSTKIADELDIISAAVSKKTQWGTFGLGYLNGSISDIPFTGITNQNTFYEIRAFSYSDTTLKAAYELDIDHKIKVGVGLSHYEKSIDNISASAMDVEAGIYYIQDPLRISFVGRNLMGSSAIYSNDGVEKLPKQIALSGKYSWGSISVYGQGMLNGNKGIMKSAAISGHIPGIPILTGSIAYREFFVVESLKSSIAYGVGMDIFGINIDYAMESSEYAPVNYKHYFSFNMDLQLGDFLNPKPKKETPKGLSIF
jgi:hypothetical protein